MGPVRLQHVVSFSSQDSNYPVNNLLQSGQLAKGWHSSPKDKSGLIEAEFQLEKASFIHYIDIGNFGSSTVELLVGCSSWGPTRPYMSLLPAVPMMTFAESKKGANRVSVRMFTSDDLNNDAISMKWDRVKVICSQPFRKDIPFGISFLRLSNRETETESSNKLFVNSLKNLIQESYSKKVKANGDVLKTFSETKINKSNHTYSRGQALVNMAKKLNHSEKNSSASNNEATFETDVVLFLTSTNWEELTDSCHDCMIAYEADRAIDLDVRQARVFQLVYENIYESNSSSRSSPHPANSFYSKSPSSSSKKRKECNSDGDDVVSFNVDFENRNGHLSEDRLQNGHSNDNSPDVDRSRRKNKGKRFKSTSSNQNAEVITLDDDVESFVSSPRLSSSSHVRDEFVQFDGSKPGTSKEVTYLDCPICSQPFHVSEIEMHAATCDKFAANNSDNETSDNSDVIHRNCHTEKLSECPVCGNMFQINVLQSHANVCMENCFA